MPASVLFAPAVPLATVAVVAMSATPNMDHSVFLGGPMLIYPKRHADPRHVIVTALLADVQFCTTALHQVARRRYTAGTRQSQPRPGVARRLCNTRQFSGTCWELLQNRFELGPLGSIGVNPGQYRVGVDAAGVELGSLAAALARPGAAELPYPRPQPGSCSVPHRRRPLWKPGPVIIHHTQYGLNA